MNASSWTRVLALALPDSLDTLLLQACLLQGEGGAQAMSAWLAAVDPPVEYLRSERRGLKRLLPLLGRSLKGTRMSVPGELLAVLRAAELHEDLRSRAFRREVPPIIECLRTAAVDVTVLPGVALVPVHYRDWSLRHCHDLDLWVHAHQRSIAEVALTDARLARLKIAAGWDGSSILKSQSGLEVALHSRLSPIRLLEPQHEALLAKRHELSFEGIRCEALGDTDMLLYVCLRAACSASRRSLRWACDAVRLIGSPPGIDWDRFIEVAERCRASLPLSVFLGFLAGELSAPVPDGVVRQLAEEGELTPELEEAFSHIVAADRQLEVGRLLRRAPALGARASMLRHLLFPSASFLERECGVRGTLEVTRMYCSRMRRALGRLAAPIAGPGREASQASRRRGARAHGS